MGVEINSTRIVSYFASSNKIYTYKEHCQKPYASREKVHHNLLRGRESVVGMGAALLLKEKKITCVKNKRFQHSILYAGHA